MMVRVESSSVAEFIANVAGAGASDKAGLYNAVNRLRGPHLWRSQSSFLSKGGDPADEDDGLWFDETDYVSSCLPPVSKKVLNVGLTEDQGNQIAAEIQRDYRLTTPTGEPIKNPKFMFPVIEMEGYLMLQSTLLIPCRVGLMNQEGNVCLAVYLPHRSKATARPHLKHLNVSTIERLRFGDFELKDPALNHHQLLISILETQPNNSPGRLFGSCCRKVERKKTLPIIVRRPADGRVTLVHTDHQYAVKPAPVEQPPMMEQPDSEDHPQKQAASPSHWSTATGGRLSFSRLAGSFKSRHLLHGADYKTLKRLRLSHPVSKSDLSDRAVEIVLKQQVSETERPEVTHITMVSNTFDEIVDLIELLALGYMYKERQILPLELRGKFEQR